MFRFVAAVSLAIALGLLPFATLLCGHACALAPSVDATARTSTAGSCHGSAGAAPTRHLRGTHACMHAALTPAVGLRAWEAGDASPVLLRAPGLDPASGVARAHMTHHALHRSPPWELHPAGYSPRSFVLRV